MGNLQYVELGIRNLGLVIRGQEKQKEDCQINRQV